MDNLKQQEEIRKSHGCNVSMPCQECDNKVTPIRKFVTGEGIYFINIKNYFTKNKFKKIFG